MALTAQNSIFAFGPQTAKGAVATTWYRHKALSIGFGVADEAQLGPLEIGSSPFPTFPYKAGYVANGQVVVMPRMAESFGWLLMGMLGDTGVTQCVTGGTKQVETATVAGTVTLGGLAKVIVTGAGITGSPITLEVEVATDDTATIVAGLIRTAIAANFAIREKYVVGGTGATVTLTAINAAADDATLNIDIDNDTCTGLTAAPTSANTTPGSAGTAALAYDNMFKPAADKGLVKWMSLRKYVPPREGDNTTQVGETYTDVKVTGMALAVAQDQPLQATIDFLGCDYAFTNDISGWAYHNTYEDWKSVPLGCSVGGGIVFNGGGLINETLPAVRATINWQNVPLPVDQERQIGSPGLPDVTIIERRCTFDVTVKLTSELYKAILTGSKSGTAWTAAPFFGDLSLVLASSQKIGYTGLNYQMKLYAPSIMWRMNGPLTMAAGQSVIMRFQGTVLEPDAGDYFQITTRSAEPSYTWPV